MKTQTKPTANAITLTFVPHADKPETKNCYRFDERSDNGQPPRIGTLYIQKWALGNSQPPEITLTINMQ